MYSPKSEKDTAIFTAESIQAMGPVAQEIAKLLQEHGRIVIEAPAEGKA